jgi:hypothetical protein
VNFFSFFIVKIVKLEYDLSALKRKKRTPGETGIFFSPALALPTRALTESILEKK